MTRIVLSWLVLFAAPLLLPSPPALRGRGVGGEGVLSDPRHQPPHPQPLSPEAGARGARICSAAAPLLADAKDDVMKLLTGKWLVKQKTGEREIVGLMEFTADGKVSMTVKSERGENSHAGTYKLTDADNIEVTYTIRDVSLTDRSKLKVTKATLELTDEKGRTLRYTRVP